MLALAEESRVDGSVALRVHGIVDDDSVEEFETGLDAAMGVDPGRLVLDLSECRLDSAGLAALVRAQRRWGGRPSAARVVATNADQLRLLQIVGLRPGFHVFPSLDAALQSRRQATRVLAGAAAAGPQTSPR